MRKDIEERLLSFKDRVLSYFKSPGSAPRKRLTDQDIEKVPLSSDVIDLETAEEMDRGSQVQFYDTENSSAARGAPKTLPQGGIDRFGKQEVIDTTKEHRAS